jgi:hypothetical protein
LHGKLKKKIRFLDFLIIFTIPWLYIPDRVTILGYWSIIALVYMWASKNEVQGKNPKKNLSLICFGTCPNYEPVKETLQEIGLIFKEINQDNLKEGDFGKKFKSPTLIMNTDNIIFGGMIDSHKGACSSELPNRQKIMDLLKAVL